MSHKYLAFSDSYYEEGKCVGTGTNEYVNALTDKTVTKIQIPRKFESKNVVEIRCNAFMNSHIISVFIPSTVLYINQGAFLNCYDLREFRLEKGSKLREIDFGAFEFSISLECIDFPESLGTIESEKGHEMFSGSGIKCISYQGTIDFSSYEFFSSYMTDVTIHTTSSYPSGEFGQRSVTKDGKKCGVSNEPFYKGRKIETRVVERTTVNDLLLMFFLATS